MKANELKINNWINYNSCNFKINSIIHPEPFIGENYSHKWLIALDNNCLTVTLDKIKPIPLTEEWLIKLGFNQNKKNNGTFNKDLFKFHTQRPNHKNKGFILCTEIYWCQKRVIVSGGVKYLHQLQNLYFALTQKELTFKN